MLIAAWRYALQFRKVTGVAYNLTEIEGIGAVYAKTLGDAGLKTTDDLLTSAGSATGRKNLAEKTGLTAARFRLKGRGRLAVDHFADLVLFEEAQVIDAATYETPVRPAVGIRQVFVNGRGVWGDGAATGARPGRPLLRA